MDSDGPVPGRRRSNIDHLLWRGLLGALPGYAWLKAPDGRYLDCNEAFALHFGLTREGVRGLSDNEITDSATAAAFIDSDRLVASLAPGQALQREEEMQLPDGRIERFELFKQVLRDATGAPLAIVGLGRPVGEARRAQRLRDDYAERLALAMECAELAQWEVDLPSGRMCAIDPRLAQILGLEDGDPLPDMARYEAFIHPDDRARRQATRDAYLAGRSARYECEYRMRHRAGHWVWLLARAKVVERAADGTPLRLVGTHMDITWRKQAEAQAQAAGTAVQLARAQADLLSRMSHELRTPLNAVLGFTQLMRMAQAQGLPPRADYLALVDDAARQLLRLVDDALQLRSAASQPAALAVRPVNLHAAVDEALALLAPLAAERAVRVANEVDPTMSATGDPAALRQVLVNLCSNAIRFNRHAGTVRIHAEPHAPDPRVRLHVQDSGEGLGPAEVARLFQPFERLGRMTGADGGSGLGLVISRTLAHAMGGSVTVSSQQGVGTRATLELPA